MPRAKIPAGMSVPAQRYSRMAFRAILREAYKGSTLHWAAPLLGKQVGVSAATVINWWDGKDAPTPQMWEKIIAACVAYWSRPPETLQAGSS